VEGASGSVTLDVILLQCGLSDLTVRCLRSIRETSDARVILVDNGSPTKDLAAVEALVDVLIENDTNLGFARAVNQGLSVATADYMCIQNNDTIMYEHGYDRLVAHLKGDERLGLVGPLTNNADTFQRVTGPEDAGQGLFYTDGLVAFFCTVMPRRTLDEVGLLSEDYGLGYGEDDDYCIRVRRAGYQLGVARDVYVHHDHHVTYRHLIGDDGIEAEGQQGLALLRDRYGATV
jgi:GT2 family glycosyltransferase